MGARWAAILATRSIIIIAVLCRQTKLVRELAFAPNAPNGLKADVAQYARELPGWNRDAVVFVCAISAGQNARTLRSPEGIIATAADNALGARDMSASDLQLTNQWPGLEKFNLVQDYLEKNK